MNEPLASPVPAQVTQDAFHHFFVRHHTILKGEARLAGMIYELRVRGPDMIKALQNEEVRECLTYFTWNKDFQLYLLGELVSVGELATERMKRLFSHMEHADRVTRIEGTM